MQLGKPYGPFVLEKEIGAGAMGTVYKALYTKTKQTIAIKIISVGLDSNPKAVARFEREMAILKKLNHPGIVKLFASGHKGGKPFYAMEYIEGESLEKVLERRGRMDWEAVVAIGQQICDALQHAHMQGIVHRDLKPANIMMTPEGDAKLTDFGIAKGVDVEQLTGTNAAVGTAAYMSPEQCKGQRDLTGKSDLYSLGVMFYEMLTGRRPFLADNTLDMFLAHVEGKFERPSRFVLDIPIWLDTLICQMLEKDPDKRPMDAAMVGQSLGRVLEKVQAQRSAGVDVVSRGVMDRPKTDNKRDDTDKEAARTLRAAVEKRKIKKKTKPLYATVLFQIISISALCAAVGGIVYIATRPPAPEELFARAQKLMAKSDFDDRLKAREGPIKDYFHHYPNRNDMQATQMQEWADDVDRVWRERSLLKRMKMQMTAENDAEAKAHAAVRFEEAGDLTSARKDWQELEKYKSEKNPELRPWGLLAVQRIIKLNEVDDLDRQLNQVVEPARVRGEEVKIDREPEKRAALALHFELFGDYATALNRWRNIKESTQTNSDQRPWFLLAARKTKEMQEKDKKPAKELIQQQLESASMLGPEKTREAVLICRDVITLYGKDSDLTNQVAQAKTLLKQLMSNTSR